MRLPTLQQALLLPCRVEADPHLDLEPVPFSCQLLMEWRRLPVAYSTYRAVM